MEKLELKHLAPYLPYGLKCTNSKESYLQTGEDRIGNLETLSINDDECVIMGENGYFLVSSDGIVPILKHLHDLTRGELEKQGYWHHIDWLTYELQTSKRNNGIKGLEKHINDAPYEMIDYLFSQHYDVFGLIDKGLAISYSDVQYTSNEG